MTNLPLRMTYEHASAMSKAIDTGLETIRTELRELGYAENTIELEIGLQLARRATNFLDAPAESYPQPVNGHGNGVNKP